MRSIVLAKRSRVVFACYMFNSPLREKPVRWKSPFLIISPVNVHVHTAPEHNHAVIIWRLIQLVSTIDFLHSSILRCFSYGRHGVATFLLNVWPSSRTRRALPYVWACWQITTLSKDAGMQFYEHCRASESDCTCRLRRRKSKVFELKCTSILQFITTLFCACLFLLHFPHLIAAIKWESMPRK